MTIWFIEDKEDEKGENSPVRENFPARENINDCSDFASDFMNELESKYLDK